MSGSTLYPNVIAFPKRMKRGAKVRRGPVAEIVELSRQSRGRFACPAGGGRAAIVGNEMFHDIKVALRAIIADEYAKQLDLRRATLFANVPPINDDDRGKTSLR